MDINVTIIQLYHKYTHKHTGGIFLEIGNVSYYWEISWSGEPIDQCSQLFQLEHPADQSSDYSGGDDRNGYSPHLLLFLCSFDLWILKFVKAHREANCSLLKLLAVENHW
ncbi:hypothetical protein T4E_212 [Trichinella pseudospiralis]|uniref:Uncharacterized protein n=1 Tax=Trichinella pseudospiralis TaxID=6337 RepID=A0A0V0Y162_TRIPS|nr:hypothetical protein T4E_212 [Trichinella pseudospiralis]